jgi:hypothetical protein
MPKGKGSQEVRKRLTRVVVPVVGLLAVTTALALVGIAPIVLFPPSNEAGPRPIAPSASSEVARVTAPPLHGNGGSGPTAATGSSNGPRATSPDLGAPKAGPKPAEEGGTVSQPEQPDVDQPDVDQPDKVARPGEGPAGEDEDHGKPDDDNGQGKQKTKHGKALGHSKDKAKGKAKGHEKWQGRASVAFPSGAAKPGHVHPSSALRHSGRSHRPHARPRG